MRPVMDVESEAGRTRIERSGASEHELRQHYDLGNDFYRLWLDPSMTYSCAMWKSESDTLYDAQMRKLDYHVREARAAGQAAVLDIGCGWGSMLKRLTEFWGVRRAVGLTLSEAQAQSVVPTERTQVKLESWVRHEPGEPYDALISIGAFEHFARPTLSRDERIGAYRAFFTRCRDLLRPGGALSLQTIAFGGLQALDPFITDRIFPGSALPSPAEILTSIEGKFELVRLRDDRADYERTCRQWAGALKSRRIQAVALVGADTVRDYEVFLRNSATGFRSGALRLLRLTLNRLG